MREKIAISIHIILVIMKLSGFLISKSNILTACEYLQKEGSDSENSILQVVVISP